MAKKNVYIWTTGCPYTKFNVQDVGEYLESCDTFTPKELVDRARDPDCPLHEIFEWDDRVAAGKYRTEEARHITRSVEIVVRLDSKTGKPAETMRGWHSIQVDSEDEETEEKRYVSVAFLSQSKRGTKEVIQFAKRELDGWINRHKQYQQVLGSAYRAVEVASAKLKTDLQKKTGATRKRRQKTG